MIETSIGRLRPRDDSLFVRHRIGVALRKHNDDGVHTYRIPALTTSAKGTLLCVYDMRRRMGRDLQEDIDIGLSRSTDGGQTWQPHETNRDTLIEPNCNGSLLRFDYHDAGEKKRVLLFANPHTQKGRTHHTIQVSFDDGRSWPESHHLLLDEGRGAGYPSLTRVDDSHVGIVYEGSQSHLVFEKLSLDELLRL